MAPASSQTVLGNFEGATFSYAGSTSRFYRSDGHYFVRTDGPDGTMADFQIKYTFGVYPLQQYLVELAGGRLQALSIAWDARATKEGGQRWFHLYPDERVTHADELHWTRPSQNWNFMCADCHSTAVRKNYDAVADRFATRWSEISVGCEACHGPGSNHVTWAGQSNGNRKKAASYKGLNVRLDERNAVTWKRNAATGNSTRSRVRATEREIEVCAQCHSRRRQVAEGYVAGKPFLDFYRPALLTQPLYHSDGQQRDEVYNWGSFLQSRMYAAGVSCSDCHNPHSGKLRVQGNAVCASCHLPGKYDTPDHHHHKTGSTGAACASCHMPPATYMVIDPRHDHSLRTPRPDLTVKYGTPNACSVCHKTRSASWAAARVQDWFGPARTPDQRDQIAAAFSEADTAAQRQQLKLRALSADRALPVITRATALAALDLAAQQSVPEILAASVNETQPLMRLAAIQSVAQLPPEQRLSLVAPLLSDSLRALRVEAARALAGNRSEWLGTELRTAFQRAADDFIESQRFNADRADARVSLGTFLAERGDAANAESQLKTALTLDPLFLPAYVNLTDLYRM